MCVCVCLGGKRWGMESSLIVLCVERRTKGRETDGEHEKRENEKDEKRTRGAR